jgi:hypothetical protein
MRIISNFKDFYDGISHQYLDKEILYLRSSVEESPERAKVPEVSKFEIIDSPNNVTYFFSLELLGFCGKIYPMAVVRTTGIEYKPTEFNQYSQGFFSYDKLVDFVNLKKIPIKEGRRYRWFNFSYQDSLADIARFFETTTDYNKLDKVFQRLNTPVFVLRETGRRERKLITNPMLKNFSFQKFKDPFTTHQELFMYVGGILRQPDREMVKLTDKQKLEKRGFDKWSFRKPPEGK